MLNFIPAPLGILQPKLAYLGAKEKVGITRLCKVLYYNDPVSQFLAFRGAIAPA
jgi:hypothetical protein